MFWVYAVRDDLEIFISLKLLINIKHIAVHNRADGRAGSKEEIRHVNSAVQTFIGDGIAVLVHCFKCWDGLVNGVCNSFAIYSFGYGCAVTVNLKGVVCTV